MNLNERGAARLFAAHGEAWAITPSHFEHLSHAVEGDVFDRPKPEARTVGGGGKGKPSAFVLPIRGVLTLRPDIGTGTTYEQIEAWLTQALAHGAGCIVADIESPGGSVGGVLECAAAIRSMRDMIPIVGVVNPFCGSAAYWLAAQMSEIVITPSGESGSIGVWSAHADVSGAMDKAGYKITLVHAGKYKVEGNPYEPLDAEARDEMQRAVDEWHNRFIADVAKGRATTEARIRHTFGEGRMMRANDAMRVRMVDRVGTLNDTIRRVTSARFSKTRAALDELNRQLGEVV